jgi:hypothetical protein
MGNLGEARRSARLVGPPSYHLTIRFKSQPDLSVTTRSQSDRVGIYFVRGSLKRFSWRDFPGRAEPSSFGSAYAVGGRLAWLVFNE